MKTLLEKTLDLAKICDMPVSMICKDADIKARWYYMLIAGKISAPDVNKVERLYNTLKKPKFKPLEG